TAFSTACSTVTSKSGCAYRSAPLELSSMPGGRPLSTALVTGAIERIHAVAMALKREGFDALAWEGPTPGAADGLPRRSVACYVQLAGGLVPWRSALGAEGTILIHRVDTVASLSPLLALDATVVLVADERGWDPARRPRLHGLA